MKDKIKILRLEDPGLDVKEMEREFKKAHILFEKLEVENKEFTADYILKGRLKNLPAAIVTLIKHNTENERSETERKIIQSENNLRTIFENTSEGFLLMDRNCMIKAFNKKSEHYAFFVKGKKMRVGDFIFDFINESRKALFSQVISNVLKGDKVQYELFHEISKGKKRWIDFSITPVIEAGEVNGICITGRDITEKKSIEQEREFDNSNLFALINNTDDLMWSIDKDLRLITFNDSFKKIIEFTAGKSFVKGDYILSDHFSKDQINRYSIYYQRALSGEAFKVVDHFDSPIEFWSEISFYPIRKANEVIGTACFSRDITQQKTNQEKIIKSEEQYKDLVDNISDLICTHDLEGKILSANSAAIKLTGYDISKLQNFNIKDLLFRDVNNSFQTYIENIQKNGFGNGIMEIKTQSGEIRIWEYSNTLKTTGVTKPIVRGYARDITESKKAADKIRFNAELLNTVGQAVIATDINGIIIYWNNVAEQIYGWLKEEAIGKKIIDIAPAQQSSSQAMKIRKALSKGNSWQGEYVVQRKDGTVFPAFVTDSPIKNEQGELTGVISVSINITERKKAEENLKLLENKILEQKIQEQRKIARAIIQAQEKERNYLGQELHDNINQVLSGTKLYLGLAGDENAEIRESVRYPIELISATMEEIRLLCSNLVTPLKNINLEELVTRLLNKLEYAGTGKTNFTCCISEKNISDDLKLNIYRIIQEQINNIAKYARARNVNIKIMGLDRSINIIVSDDGNGFEVEKKRNGIGITNMINRVESFNGEIEIISSPGNGCITTISIPC